MKELTNQQLFEDKNTIAWELISRYKYPFEVLPAISEYIVTRGESLPEDRYEKRGDNVWIARSASVAESASITGPVIIDEDAEIRHCDFIRGNAIVGKALWWETPRSLKTSSYLTGSRCPTITMWEIPSSVTDPIWGQVPSPPT